MFFQEHKKCGVDHKPICPHENFLCMPKREIAIKFLKNSKIFRQNSNLMKTSMHKLLSNEDEDAAKKWTIDRGLKTRKNIFCSSCFHEPTIKRSKSKKTTSAKTSKFQQQVVKNK